MAHTLAEALTIGHGIERPFLCPVHGDSRPSASVNVTTGAWVCYTCGAKGKAGEGTYEIPLDALEELARELGRSYTPTIYSEGWLNVFDAGGPHPYWRSRFTDEAISYFRLGYALEDDAATYPFRDANRHVLGVVRRPLGADHGPKYLYPRGLKVGDYLFNYSPDQRDIVVLTEGATDAIAAWEAGVDAFAIYGARISARQISLIRRTSPRLVLCAFDADSAGEEAYERVAEEIKDIQVGRITWEGYKDLSEMPVQTRTEILEDAFVKARKECSVSAWHSGSSGSTPTPRSTTVSRHSTATSKLGRLKIMRSS